MRCCSTRMRRHLEKAVSAGCVHGTYMAALLKKLTNGCLRSFTVVRQHPLATSHATTTGPANVHVTVVTHSGRASGSDSACRPTVTRNPFRIGIWVISQL